MTKIKLNTLTPNPDNPRVISDDELASLAASIKEVPEMMAMRPMLIDENRVVIGGNQRYRALSEILQIEEVPEEWCYFLGHIADETRRRIILQDNASYGRWDLKELPDLYRPELLKEIGYKAPSVPFAGAKSKVEMVKLGDLRFDVDADALTRWLSTLGDDPKAEIRKRMEL